MFRDESERVIRKARQSARDARQLEQSRSISIQENLTASPGSAKSGGVWFDIYPIISSKSPVSIFYPLCQPITELGANFFVTKYSLNEPPFSADYHDWLTQSYFEDGPNDVLRASIEAVGMAGIANVFHTAQVASKSKQRYCEALAALRQALDDPVQAIADTTFLAVILLGLFETVNFETWDRYHHWEAHVKAATTLLELRGQEQFTRERGGQLYIQVRSQILLASVQQHMFVPPGLVRTTYNFETSGIRKQWKQRNIASPASICTLSFRIVNLRAAFKTGEMTDQQLIRETALDIDRDLETWKAGVPRSWRYATVDDPNTDSGTCFQGKRHVYPNLWIAEAWNNWRSLRILVNQIILQNELRTNMSDIAERAVESIRHFSAELCISISSFTDSPRIVSFIRTLYVVSMERQNPQNLRSFALEQLRRIDASMGIRVAGLLAETGSRRINSCSGYFINKPRDCMIPLIPCG